jgi:phage shock protein PspC (stress-responsive transcriptional regulator)
MRGLYRNSDDQWIAGVCGGLAKQFEIDPSIIRVLMALFCTSGWGLLIYAVFWIVLPRKPLGDYEGRRFIRDMNNKVLAGVCSGVAHYFGWDVRVVRVVFIAPVVLALSFGVFSWPFFLHGTWYWNFFFQGSIVGSFAFAYILLWVILPPSQDVESTQASEEAAPSRPAPLAAPSITPPAQAGHQIASSIGQSFGAIFRVFLFFLAGILIFCLFVFLMASLFAGAFLWPLNGFIWTSEWQQYYALATLIFFVGVPFLGFIIWLIRRAMGVQSGSHLLRWIFGLLWLVGVASLVFLVTSVVGDFRYYERSDALVIPIRPEPLERLLVTVSEPALKSDHDWLWDREPGYWNFTETTLRLPFVDIKATKSSDSDFHVAVIKFSAGRSREDAIRRAGEVEYQAHYQNGVLDLGSGFTVQQSSKYRFQNIYVGIEIPVGKKIRFDASAKDKLSRIEVRVASGQRWSKNQAEIRTESFPWKTDTDYVMTQEGHLLEQSTAAH